MMIDCISDLHGHYPKLEGGDLLIVAGDLANDNLEQIYKFKCWISKLIDIYKKMVIVAGNHDNWIEKGFHFNRDELTWQNDKFCYLEDSGVEITYDDITFINPLLGERATKKLKIWGSPWTKTFPGMNPLCKAFTCGTEEELAEKFALIPNDIDILVTHSPAKFILDWNNYGDNCGSSSLINKATSLPNLKLFVCGHIHESYGVLDTSVVNDELNHLLIDGTCKSYPIIVNASHVNERYEPVNKPIRIEL